MSDRSNISKGVPRALFSGRCFSTSLLMTSFMTFNTKGWYIIMLMTILLVFDICYSDILKNQLVWSTETVIRCFMRTNTSKFQSIVMSSGANDTSFTINVFDNELMPSKCVKMLGVHIDGKPYFEKKKISSICSRASNHIHALNRLSKFLNGEVKIKLYNTFVLSIFCSVVQLGIYALTNVPTKWKKSTKEHCVWYLMIMNRLILNCWRKRIPPRMKTVGVGMYKGCRQLNPNLCIKYICFLCLNGCTT